MGLKVQGLGPHVVKTWPSKFNVVFLLGVEAEASTDGRPNNIDPNVRKDE